MPKALKIILAIVAVFFLVCTVAAVVGGKLLKDRGSAVMRDARAAVQEGRAWGVTRDGTQCVTEGLRRNDPCGMMAIGCQIQSQSFARACLDTAADAPSVCTDVPSPTSFGATTTWRIHRCDALGHNGDQKCLNFMQGIQQFCVDRSLRLQSGRTAAPVVPAVPMAPAEPSPSTPK